MMSKIVITLGAVAASISSVSIANAQTVVTQPSPPPQTTVVQQPQPAQTVVTQPQPAVVAQPPSQQTVVVPERERASTGGGPNPTLLTSGLFVFGVPYGISVVVAAESDRDGDKNLFVPVVGPWLAYANEGTCHANDLACGRTTGTKVLLAADGIFQAIGAVELVAAFMVPAPRAVASSPREKHVMVAPSRIGPNGYGISAAGSF
jgi:hypothetical protein